MRRFLLIVALTLLFPHLAEAASLLGVVRAKDTGAAIGFVNVQVSGRTQAGAVVQGGVLGGENGGYLIEPLPLGRYRVAFTRVGYRAREDSLIVAEERTYVLDVALEFEPVRIEGVRVEANTARPFAETEDVQTGFVSIRADRLSELPGIAEGDPVRALDLIPGVQSASDFSSAPYVRGGGPDQTLVLFDQATVYNPTHAFGFFSTFNADATGDVNLYKGAYPAEHGGRLGAVLDVRSRDARAQEFFGKLGISTIASRLALDGPIRGGSWAISARRTHLEPLLNAIRDEDTEVPDYFFYDLNGKLSVPSGGGRFDVSIYNGRDDLDFFPGGDTSLELRWGNTVATTAFVRALSDRFVVSARASFSDYQSNTVASAFATPATFENSVQDLTVGGDAKWEASLRHTFTAGLQASRYDVAFSQTFNGQLVDDYRREPVEAAAFLEDRWTPWGDTAFDLGLRARYIDDGERFLLEPRVAAAQVLRPDLRVKAGAGIYHQYLQLVATEAVAAVDFYVPIDETAPLGRSWQLVAGADWRWKPSVLFSIEGYYTDLENLVLLDNTSTVNVEIETADDLFYLGGDGYAAGVELFARRDMGSVTGWIGYTLGWTRRAFPEIEDGETFAPKYDRRHDISAVAEHRRGKWRFTGAFVYATGQAYTPVSGRYSLRDPTTGSVPGDIQLLYADKNSARLLAYNRLDLGVARDFSFFGARAEWLVEVFNIYSRKNEWFVEYERDGEIVEAEVVRMLPIIPSIGINIWF
ncbi:MAG: TonB-dependent receptor [Candidatus Latescibacteria bacterium]|nr:TonB-dependent receptor [Candidatus Latescibacterota bacterium]